MSYHSYTQICKITYYYTYTIIAHDMFPAMPPLLDIPAFPIVRHKSCRGAIRLSETSDVYYTIT